MCIWLNRCNADCINAADQSGADFTEFTIKILKNIEDQKERTKKKEPLQQTV